MRHLFRFSAISILLLGIASCSNSYDNPTPAPTPTPTPNSITFKATLNAASTLNPANTSTAKGTATLIFDNTTKKFSITVNYSGMTANAAHIHKGTTTTVSGPIIFPLTFVPGDAYTTAYYTLTNQDLDPATTQEADLKANLYYVNIHSIAYPDGEIRGQLIKQ